MTAISLSLVALAACLAPPATAAPHKSIGVYSLPAGGGVHPTGLSAFLAGYLGNEKNYPVRNLDWFHPGSTAAALAKARGLGLDALLVAAVDGFARGGNTAAARLHLIDAASGDTLRQWSARLTAPFFDPPYFRHSRPYGNLAEVFADFAPRTYAAARVLRLLVATDQDLGGDSAVGPYIRAQIATADRVLRREAGIGLALHDLVRWDPPSDLDLFDTARAAARIPRRQEADLTLVALGPPAPYRAEERIRTIGYARVLGNILATRRTNAHVIVHEIAHVLGAIHTDEEGAIMRPALEQYHLTAGQRGTGPRYKVLPPIRFSALNKDIIRISRTLPLGTALADHFDKVDQLLALYRDLQPTHPQAVAPYYGDLLLNAGRTEEAIAVFTRALQSGSPHPSLRGMLAEALERAGRYREAQALVQAAFDDAQADLKRQTGGVLQLKPQPTLSLSASILSFGQVLVGYKRNMPLTLSNLGTAPLKIQRVGAPRSPFSFAALPPAALTIAPGESHTLKLTFQPDEPKSYLASIEIHSNAPKQHIAVVRLSGTGAE